MARLKDILQLLPLQRCICQPAVKLPNEPRALMQVVLLSAQLARIKAPLAYTTQHTHQAPLKDSETLYRYHVMSAIKYRPLSPETKQIRTLTLCAGKVDNPIRCALQNVSLDEQPAYTALSYTWGDATITAPIEVDGAQFDATVNLERALRHLRKVEGNYILWVDAGESSENM